MHPLATGTSGHRAHSSSLEPRDAAPVPPARLTGATPRLGGDSRTGVEDLGLETVAEASCTGGRLGPPTRCETLRSFFAYKGGRRWRRRRIAGRRAGGAPVKLQMYSPSRRPAPLPTYFLCTISRRCEFAHGSSSGIRLNRRAKRPASSFPNLRISPPRNRWCNVGGGWCSFFGAVMDAGFLLELRTGLCLA